MKIRPLRILLSAITVVLPFLISDNEPLRNVVVSSCCCRKGGSSPCEEYWRAEAVFAGKVIKRSTFSIEEGEGDSRHMSQQMLVRFSIEQAFRGIAGDEVEIVTGMGGGDCGYRFKDNERYVVYAIRAGRDKGRLYAGDCNRIRLMAEAEEDLAYFRDLPPAGTGGVVFGRVNKWTRPLNDDGRHQETYLNNIKITIEGNGKQFETATDKDGRYRISGLAPGQYRVKADLPEGQSSSSHESVEVIDRGCTASDFYVQPNGQISGRVFDEKGAPLSNITVDLVPAGDVQNPFPKGKRWSTDDEGRYKFEWVPPGNYYLGVGLDSGYGNLCPYPRVYLPDFRDPKEAKVVSMKEGYKIEDQNISLPSVASDLEFEVEIVWPDGRPAETAVMLLHGEGHAVHSTGQRDPAGKPGHFRVKTYKACSYWVTAYTYGHPGEPGGGEPRHGEAKVDSSASFAKPIRVTLSQPGFMCEHRRPKDWK